MSVFQKNTCKSQKSRLTSSPIYMNALRNLTIESNEFYSKYNPFQNLTDEIDNTPNPSPEQIIALSEEFITIDTLKPVVDFEAERYVTYPLYNSPVTALNTGSLTGWILINHPLFMVMLLVFDAVEFSAQKRDGKITSVINFPAGDISLRILKSNGFTCSHWRAPLITDSTSVHTKLKCEREKTETYYTGDRIFTRGGTQTVVYEEVKDTTVALQVYCRHFRTNVMVDYDPQTLGLQSLSVADQRSSRVQFLSTILRMFDRQDAQSELEKLLAHPDHFVRWQVARELVSLAPERAKPVLDELANNDCNPHVRKSATRTLELFY